jgi:hypothetical protein
MIGSGWPVIIIPVVSIGSLRGIATAKSATLQVSGRSTADGNLKQTPFPRIYLNQRA